MFYSHESAHALRLGMEQSGKDVRAAIGSRGSVRRNREPPVDRPRNIGCRSG